MHECRLLVSIQLMSCRTLPLFVSIPSWFDHYFNTDYLTHTHTHTRLHVHYVLYTNEDESQIFFLLFSFSKWMTWSFKMNEQRGTHTQHRQWWPPSNEVKRHYVKNWSIDRILSTNDVISRKRSIIWQWYVHHHGHLTLPFAHRVVTN